MTPDTCFIQNTCFLQDTNDSADLNSLRQWQNQEKEEKLRLLNYFRKKFPTENVDILFFKWKIKTSTFHENIYSHLFVWDLLSNIFSFTIFISLKSMNSAVSKIWGFGELIQRSWKILALITVVSEKISSESALSGFEFLAMKNGISALNSDDSALAHSESNENDHIRMFQSS